VYTASTGWSNLVIADYADLPLLAKTVGLGAWEVTVSVHPIIVIHGVAGGTGPSRIWVNTRDHTLDYKQPVGKSGLRSVFYRVEVILDSIYEADMSLDDPYRETWIIHSGRYWPEV
jgi:hypothetical protein